VYSPAVEKYYAAFTRCNIKLGRYTTAGSNRLGWNFPYALEGKPSSVRQSRFFFGTKFW